MAIAFFIDKRKVIPNWRSFKATISLNELSANSEFSYNGNVAKLYGERLLDWTNNPCIVTAAELLNATLVLDYESNAEVQKASEFVLEHPESSSVLLTSLANKFINPDDQTRDLALHVLDAFEEFEAIQRKEKLYHKINIIKRKLSDFPKNPILWIELSRHYSILGQLENAKKAMQVSNSLAPNNRFILRSFARLFVQSEDYDIAHDVLRKSTLVNTDPWITSAEIAVAGLRKRQSKFVGRGLAMINSKKFNSFSITELNSSIATLELEHGNIKKARAYFKDSLVAPNDNSLAQVEWANQEERKLDITIAKSLLPISTEAQAYDCYDKSDWRGVIENCLRWFIDMPQSKTSMLLAFHVSTIFLKDYEMAVKFCNAALVSHPNDPTLLNNRAYALTLLKRLDEAFDDIKRGESLSHITDLEKVCLTATKGLLHYRKGEIEQGRNLYLEAITAAKKINEPYYFNMAFLNFAREELMLKTNDSKEIIKRIEKLIIDSEYKDLTHVKSDILKLASKKGGTVHFHGNSGSINEIDGS